MTTNKIQIENIIQAWVNENYGDDDSWNIASLSQHLSEKLGGDDRSVNISWHIEDVRNIEGASHLSDDACMEVLNFVKDNHDASIGVNWEVIEYAITRCDI